MLWLNLRKLKSKDPRTRILGISKIGKSDDETAFQSLCQLVHDPDKAVRKAAICQLIGRVIEKGERKGIRFIVSCLGIEELEEDIQDAIKQIYKKDPYVKTKLIESLASGNRNVQKTALACLEEMTPSWWKSPYVTDEIQFLTRAMTDENRTVKEGAIAALGHFGDARAVESLKAEKEKQPELRDHFEAALKKAEDRLAQLKTSFVPPQKNAEVQNCAVCNARLDFSRKIESGIHRGSELLNSIGSTPYRCRHCAIFVCMNCASTRLCPQCGGNTFDAAPLR